MATKGKTIGGSLFEVTPLPAFQSFTLQAEIAPAIAAVVGAMGPLLAGDLGSADVAEMGKAAQAFFTAMPRQRFASVARELLEGTTMDGKPLFTPAGSPFDIWMQGRTLDAWLLLWFAIEVNYPDFFGLLGARRDGPTAASRSGASTT